MAFADNNLSDDLRTRIIAGEVGSSMFHTYQDKNKNEYMTDTVPQIHVVHETNKCVKTNRILSVINLMLLVLLIVLTYMMS